MLVIHPFAMLSLGELTIPQVNESVSIPIKNQVDWGKHSSTLYKFFGGTNNAAGTVPCWLKSSTELKQKKNIEHRQEIPRILLNRQNAPTDGAKIRVADAAAYNAHQRTGEYFVPQSKTEHVMDDNE